MSNTNKTNADTTNSTSKEYESINQENKGNNKNENPEEVNKGSLSSNNLTKHTEQTTSPPDPKTTTTKARTTDKPGLNGDVNSLEADTAANTATCALQSEPEQQRKANDSISKTMETPENTHTKEGSDATTTIGTISINQSKTDDQSKAEQLLPTVVPTEEAPSQDKPDDENGKCHNHIDQYDFVCSNLIKPR